MFNLFALAKDDAGSITNESLIRDLQKDPGFKQFRIFTEDLRLPRTTIVVMEKDGWRERFFIRPGEDMTLSVTEVKKVMGKNAAKLPANFLDYNTEIAIVFGDDPDKRFTNEAIEIGGFIRENYPDVVIFDQYNKDVW